MIAHITQCGNREVTGPRNNRDCYHDYLATCNSNTTCSTVLISATPRLQQRWIGHRMQYFLTHRHTDYSLPFLVSEDNFFLNSSAELLEEDNLHEFYSRAQCSHSPISNRPQQIECVEVAWAQEDRWIGRLQFHRMAQQKWQAGTGWMSSKPTNSNLLEEIKNRWVVLLFANSFA